NPAHGDVPTNPGSSCAARRRAWHRRVPDKSKHRICRRLSEPPDYPKKFDRPLHPFDAAHASEIRVFQSLRLIKILSLRIHHPDVCIGNVANLAASTFHDPGKDRRLVLQQKCTKGDGEDQTEVLRPITGEHLPSYKIHLCLTCLKFPRQSCD